MKMSEDIEKIKKLPIIRYVVIIGIALISLLIRAEMDIATESLFVEIIIAAVSCVCIAYKWVTNGLFTLKYLVDDEKSMKNKLILLGKFIYAGVTLVTIINLLLKNQIQGIIKHAIIYIIVAIVSFIIFSYMDRLAGKYRKIL